MEIQICLSFAGSCSPEEGATALYVHIQNHHSLKILDCDKETFWRAHPGKEAKHASRFCIPNASHAADLSPVLIIIHTNGYGQCVHAELHECSPLAIADASLNNGNVRSPPISLHHTIAHTKQTRSHANTPEQRCVWATIFVTWSEFCTLWSYMQWASRIVRN